MTASYEQSRKNTVKAENQLMETEYVTFENPKGTGPRIMFVGNSITLHGVADDIGWHHRWGMAASAKEKDYVHRLMYKIAQVKNDAAYCICQVAVWESKYQEGTENMYPHFEGARDFHADIIVLRLIDNCPLDTFAPEVFQVELEKLLTYLNPSGRAKIVITTGFWPHCGDETVCEFAKAHGISLVELGDLGQLDEMKAIGLFEHEGVANHPGDLGMEKIAERIYAKLEQYL